jgi:hypothetical protein
MIDGRAERGFSASVIVVGARCCSPHEARTRSHPMGPWQLTETLRRPTLKASMPTDQPPFKLRKPIAIKDLLRIAQTVPMKLDFGGVEIDLGEIAQDESGEEPTATAFQKK